MSNPKDLWIQIRDNEELKFLEMAGFMKGSNEGKTVNVPPKEVIKSLNKQIEDYETACFNFTIAEEIGDFKLTKSNTILSLKRALANLRNNAACLFMKLQEAEK